MNIDPNCVIFDSVDSSWSLLSNLLKSLISHLKFSFDLMEFEYYHKNFLILCGFDPYSPLYTLILNYNLKLMSLKFFDTSSCVLKNFTNSSC